MIERPELQTVIIWLSHICEILTTKMFLAVFCPITNSFNSDRSDFILSSVIQTSSSMFRWRKPRLSLQYTLLMKAPRSSNCDILYRSKFETQCQLQIVQSSSPDNLDLKIYKSPFAHHPLNRGENLPRSMWHWIIVSKGIIGLWELRSQVAVKNVYIMPITSDAKVREELSLVM